jgi:pancreatic triacylglycerol lipase
LGANTINFVAARQRVNEVGPIVAEFLDFLHENNELDFSRLYVIGYSLGAHTSGIAAKNVRRGRINTIAGLDPAGMI